MTSTSEQFLKSLYRGLKWRVALDEAEDIVHDYREFFDEEQKRGKTEAQTAKALGSPRQVIRTIMAEHKPTRRPAIYMPCMVLAAAVALFLPLMLLMSSIGLFGLPSAITTNTLSDYVFILLGSLPALLLYVMWPAPARHPREVRRVTMIFFGIAGISLLMFGCSSAVLYVIIMGLFSPSLGGLYPSVLFAYYPLLIAILASGVSWVFGILSTEKLGRYYPSLYFFLAAMQIAVNSHVDVLANMNLEDDPLSFSAMMNIAFSSLAKPFAFAAACAALWCGLQYSLRKRGGQ